MTQHTGGPAFPGGSNLSQNYDMVSDDMSLRDWFAGQALMSMLTAQFKFEESTYETAARLSYKFADAMLAERDK